MKKSSPLKLKRDPKKTDKKEKSVNGKISPEIEAAAEIARHYGFLPLPIVCVEKADITIAKKFQESHLKALHPFFKKEDKFGGFLEEKISLLRAFFDKKFTEMTNPIMGYYEAPLDGNPHTKKNEEEETFNLEVIGSNKSIAEAMILEASFVILRNRYPNESFCLEINSIGDKDSLARFIKELGNFIKKESPNLPKKVKEAVKKDPFALFNFIDEEMLEIQAKAPKPMTFLSESSRNHFKEILEFLETLEIPYEINHSLIGSRSYCTETIFEIKGLKDNEEHIYAIGERYNSLAKKALGKKDVHAVGVALLIHPHFVSRQIKKVKTVKSKFYFIQIGFDAKLQSLKHIELLRQANIPVEQSLSKDKLSLQLLSAEKMNIPYVLIVGQKEAHDKSIVVRNMSNMAQETVPITELVSYLKKIK